MEIVDITTGAMRIWRPDHVQQEPADHTITVRKRS
jgi:hypothetical protein